MAKHTLFRGATVLSMDPDIGDHTPGDVLISGDRITAVGATVEAPPGTEVVDARGQILIPGFVDTHRHMWEAVLRGVAPDYTLERYMSDILGRLGPALTPHDLHVGTTLSARATLLSGITTIQDVSNVHDQPAITEAVIDAHRTSGLRTVFAYGKSYPALLRDGFALPDDVRRVRDALDGSLVTLALDVEGGDDATERHNAALARDLDIRITRHFSARDSATRLRDLGALLPGTTFIHANGLPDTDLAVIADAGGSISVAPAIELVMGHGHPMVTAHHRVPLTLSTDVEVTIPSDLFTQMRAAYLTARAANVPLTVRDILTMATRTGAESLGLGTKTGTITPGKQADLVLLDTTRPDATPVIDPYSTVVLQLDRAHVTTVLVAGHPHVRNGTLLSDSTHLRAEAYATITRLASLLT